MGIKKPIKAAMFSLKLKGRKTFKPIITKIKKHINPVPIDGANLMIATSCQNINSTASLSETDSVSFDDITHCPINKEGTQVTAHIFQNNL